MTMAAKWIETVTGSLEQKKQYREGRARLDALPSPYRDSASAIHRYLMYYGGVTEGETTVRMLLDLVDLWERASLDGTSIDDLVGEDPVDFAESFAQAYLGKRWIDKERTRLVRAIDAARLGEGR